MRFIMIAHLSKIVILTLKNLKVTTIRRGTALRTLIRILFTKDFLKGMTERTPEKRACKFGKPAFIHRNKLNSNSGKV